MSITTTAPKTTPKARRRIGKPTVNHIVRKGDMALAKEMGVQVQGLCGGWGWPRPAGGPGEGAPRICKRCHAIFRSMTGSSWQD